MVKVKVYFKQVNADLQEVEVPPEFSEFAKREYAINVARERWRSENRYPEVQDVE